MKLHEFQAKRLFAQHGIPVPKGIVASTPAQARAAFTRLKRLLHAGEGFTCNIKAQIHAGGRGKAGGVLTASSAQEASAHAAKLLGKPLVTHQTGPHGLPVGRVLLDERIDVAKELYLALTVDRTTHRPMILASRRGGVDIETIAKDEPAAIARESIDPCTGLLDFQTRRIQETLRLSDETGRQFQALLPALHRCFLDSDASLAEINPLVQTRDGRLLALDAKVVLDDNALFRHPELAKLRDKSQEHPLEYKASQIGISYVGLDGNIGCVVNGAGLAMATNDIIKLSGGAPANFLDVGGRANVEQVTKAFQVVLADPRVRAIFVNIFGGITRCDWIAQGLLNATAKLTVKIPIVVRLVGTNVEAGKALLRDTSLPITSADDLGEAARRVAQLAKNP